jgi:hypothetical protein
VTDGGTGLVVPKDAWAVAISITATSGAVNKPSGREFSMKQSKFSIAILLGVLAGLAGCGDEKKPNPSSAALSPGVVAPAKQKPGKAVE